MQCGYSLHRQPSGRNMISYPRALHTHGPTHFTAYHLRIAAASRYQCIANSTYSPQTLNKFMEITHHGKSCNISISRRALPLVPTAKASSFVTAGVLSKSLFK